MPCTFQIDERRRWEKTTKLDFGYSNLDSVLLKGVSRQLVVVQPRAWTAAYPWAPLAWQDDRGQHFTSRNNLYNAWGRSTNCSPFTCPLKFKWKLLQVPARKIPLSINPWYSEDLNAPLEDFKLTEPGNSTGTLRLKRSCFHSRQQELLLLSFAAPPLKYRQREDLSWGVINFY